MSQLGVACTLVPVQGKGHGNLNQSTACAHLTKTAVIRQVACRKFQQTHAGLDPRSGLAQEQQTLSRRPRTNVGHTINIPNCLPQCKQLPFNTLSISNLISCLLQAASISRGQPSVLPSQTGVRTRQHHLIVSYDTRLIDNSWITAVPASFSGYCRAISTHRAVNV